MTFQTSKTHDWDEFKYYRSGRITLRADLAGGILNRLTCGFGIFAETVHGIATGNDHRANKGKGDEYGTKADGTDSFRFHSRTDYFITKQ